MITTLDKVEARAYDFYVNRDENRGNQFEDWLKAEKEIEAESARSTRVEAIN
jgi:hypothetical protein